jgi:hypothetical protein
MEKVIVSRARQPNEFLDMEQKEDTPLMAFIVELKAAAVLCKFGDIQDDIVQLAIANVTTVDIA